MTPTEDLDTIWHEFRATRDAGLRNRLVLQYAPLVKYVAGRLRTRMPDSVDSDDLVSDAFAKVLTVVQSGGGPDVAFRAYLLTAVRRLHVDRIRAQSKLTTSDDMSAFDPGVPFRDTAVEGFESAAAAIR